MGKKKIIKVVYRTKQGALEYITGILRETDAKEIKLIVLDEVYECIWDCCLIHG